MAGPQGGEPPCPAHWAGSAVPGPSSSSLAALCHWSSEGPGRASVCCILAFSLPLFFTFFFLFFFFFLFLSLCFPRFFRPSLEEEEEDEEEEELEELEEEEEELDRGLLRALCLLLSVMQGEGEAGRPGGEEVNFRPLALACSRLRLTTSWHGFSTLWRGTFSTPQSLSAQKQGGQPPHLRPSYTKK